jgi:cytochrome c5
VGTYYQEGYVTDALVATVVKGKAPMPPQGGIAPLSNGDLS